MHRGNGTDGTFCWFHEFEQAKGSVAGGRTEGDFWGVTGEIAGEVLGNFRGNGRGNGRRLGEAGKLQGEETGDFLNSGFSKFRQKSKKTGKMRRFFSPAC